MKKQLCFLFGMLAACTLLPAQEDYEGSKDPALFTRMPNYYISHYEDLDFDRFEFQTQDEKTLEAEGRHLSIVYTLKEGSTQKYSPIQVARNYSNAAIKIGGKVISEFDYGGTYYTIIKIVKDGKETMAQVQSDGEVYILNIIEKEAMNQDVVADATSMSNSINQTGKVAVYGIYFDTGKSVLKPESQPALIEIGRLMKADPSLKLYVVGHTDNVGAYDSNMKLSMDRATAVVNALVTQQSVAAAKLKACGDGPTAPVASNDTEEGKAKNRRVELVKQ